MPAEPYAMAIHSPTPRNKKENNMGTLVTGEKNETNKNNDDFAPPTAETTRMTESLYDGNTTHGRGDANNFYGHASLVSAIDRRGAELWEKTGTDKSARERVRESFVGIANTTGLPEGLVGTVAEGHIDNLLSKARPSEDADAAQALDEQIARWSIESRALLTSTYGAKDGEAMLARTQKFVRSHPALAKVLQERGLGSRPDIVAGIAAHVFSTGYR